VRSTFQAVPAKDPWCLFRRGRLWGTNRGLVRRIGCLTLREQRSIFDSIGGRAPHLQDRSMGCERTAGRTLKVFSVLGLAAIAAAIVLFLGIQRRIIAQQRTQQRTMMVEAATQRCDLLKRVLVARLRRLVELHPTARSLAQLSAEIEAEFAALRFLHETGQGIHALVVDDQFQPVAAIDPGRNDVLRRCAHHLNEGGERVYTRPTDAEAAGAMPSRLCYTCPIERQGELLGGLILHKELDPVGDVFAALNRSMTWTVVATQAVLLVVLGLVAWSAQRAIAHAERARAEDERLTALGNLVAGIAHEIRNPLNTIGLTCRYLERYVGQACEKPECRAEFNRNFEIVASEVGRLTRTLDDFLLLAKPTDLSLVDCDIESIVDDALALFGRELADAGIRLERHRLESLHADADRDRLLQVFSNLIKNGIQAMGDGGTLSVTSTRGNGRASVAFADTGPGIGADARHRIFEPYYSTKRSGLGLGLSLSSKIVTAHGGTIDVGSQPGGGAVFTVTLPTRPPGGEGGSHG